MNNRIPQDAPIIDIDNILERLGTKPIKVIRNYKLSETETKRSEQILPANEILKPVKPHEN